jgi:hypothetical protein
MFKVFDIESQKIFDVVCLHEADDFCVLGLSKLDWIFTL